MDVRRVQPDEWRELRDTRLNSLLDTPDAFGGTYERSEARPDEWWVEWTRDSSEADGQAVFLAWDDDKPVGMIGAFRDEDGRWNVFGTWVRPAHRGRGLGRQLLEVAIDFIRAQGAREAFLGVTEGNDGARRLYETYGFADTVVAYPLREGSPLTVRELRLGL